MTSKISIDNRELLQKISIGEAAAGIHFGNAIVRELAAFRLAAMDSEQVAEVLSIRPGNDTSTIDRALPVGTQLYRHAQQQVVPECFVRFHDIIKERHNGRMPEEVQNAFDECAAMLQAGNSPVIPDGYVMVPKEPTDEMISSGIAAHYDRSQIQIHDRPAPGPMECAYVAMLAAAPQEVK